MASSYEFEALSTDACGPLECFHDAFDGFARKTGGLFGDGGPDPEFSEVERLVVDEASALGCGILKAKKSRASTTVPRGLSGTD